MIALYGTILLRQDPLPSQEGCRLIDAVLENAAAAESFERVFPNSEELQHLDELLNVVRCKGENILIMTTSKILGKPWCLAEIARAEQMTRPTCA